MRGLTSVASLIRACVRSEGKLGEQSISSAQDKLGHACLDRRLYCAATNSDTLMLFIKFECTTDQNLEACSINVVSARLQMTLHSSNVGVQHRPDSLQNLKFSRG